MSENTTPETTVAPASPENVVPFTPAATESSAAEQAPQAASDATQTPAAGQPDENKLNAAVEQVLSHVDVNTISHHDVVHDLFRSSQDYAFKLMIAAKLFEHMLIRDAAGLKGEAFDLLRHADEAVTNEVHAILKAKVAVPVKTEVVEEPEK
jgi:hypothetical protein